MFLIPQVWLGRVYASGRIYRTGFSFRGENITVPKSLIGK